MLREKWQDPGAGPVGSVLSSLLVPHAPAQAQSCVYNFHVTMGLQWDAAVHIQHHIYNRMFHVNPNFDRLCLITADISWLDVQSLPGSRSKSGAAFQMQSIVTKSGCGLPEIPRPMCDSTIEAFQSLKGIFLCQRHF